MLSWVKVDYQKNTEDEDEDEMRELVKIIQELLRYDVKLAMGCTEPACCALATAWASSLLKKVPDKIDIEISPNILKNALEVGIPGTEGLRGLNIALALGIVLADTKDGLTLLKNVNKDILAKAKKLEDRINIEVSKNGHEIYIKVKLTAGEDVVEAAIGGSHDNLILLRHNDDIQIEKNLEEEECPSEILREKLVKYNFRDIIKAMEDIDKETEDFMIEGLNINLEISKYGMEEAVGMGVGYYYKQLMDDFVISSDLLNEAKMYTATAVDARMYGVNMPVMSSSGSGNQGIVATLPLYIVAGRWGQGREKLARAIAISHISNSYIKFFTGKLSAMCGCVAAGIGTALGAGYLLGLKRGDITGIMNNMVGNVCGIVCDGAKVGCSLKLATGVDSALTSALLVQRGIMIPGTNGICGSTPEESIVNMSKVVAPGMITADEEILKIMLERNLDKKI